MKNNELLRINTLSNKQAKELLSAAKFRKADRKKNGKWDSGIATCALCDKYSVVIHGDCYTSYSKRKTLCPALKVKVAIVTEAGERVDSACGKYSDIYSRSDYDTMVFINNLIKEVKKRIKNTEKKD